ncbi:hypothetical protein [Streptomyces sp. NPDC012888]|uniref:hypothetical protein n=1 Tax=Streptomyces sp. NPDC012888 TaxID=3364855 RepID=UPI003674848F
MSARDERRTLTPRPSLHDYALFRHGIEPDGRVPRRGFPLPDEHPGPPPARPDLRRQRARDEVTAALAPLLADPDPVRAAAGVHRAVRELRMPHHTVHAHVPRPAPGHVTAARRTARRLAAHGTDVAAVAVGIALLRHLGEPEDVQVLRTLGLLKALRRAATAALDPLDRRAAALLVLADRNRSGELTALLDAAVADGAEGSAARDALVALTGSDDPPDRDSAARWLPRRIAEAARLDRLLRARPDDARLLLCAGRLLRAMSGDRQDRAEVLDYRPATAVYEALAATAPRLPATPDRRTLLTATASDLHSGASALLDWAPGRREALLAALGPVRRPAGGAAGGPEPLRIEVVVEDPDHDPLVETRILVGGRPLLPALFRRGPGHTPEQLLDTGALRAGDAPREVQLAEAYCTEGCCGALYVTVRREGGEVVWDGWRGASAGPPPAALRFDAAAYEAEVARAEHDRGWSWPARETARLIRAALRDRPELAARWGVRRVSVATAWRDPERVLVSFEYRPGPGDGPCLYFTWELGPGVGAEEAVERFATADPKSYARLTGGAPTLATALGYA